MGEIVFDMDEILYKESYAIEQGNFTTAGEASSKIKKLLKQLGVDDKIVRMMAIVAYELEMNLVIHSLGGDMILSITPKSITLLSADRGPGIADIEKAMREGFSTAPESVRMLGFGAGMGLPNIKRNSHHFDISSVAGKGTKITVGFDL